MESSSPAPPLDQALARLAQAIAEPARARMLCHLLDGRARTATELAAIAEIGASTASSHLARLGQEGLIAVHPQGRHKYYRLSQAEVAAALEAMLVLAGKSAPAFVPRTPVRLRQARTCYDHMAGALAVQLHDHWQGQGWLLPSPDIAASYVLSTEGTLGFAELGIDVAALQRLRRRFACACLDWSERRPHLGGALGAAVLSLLLEKKWVAQDEDERSLRLTTAGQRAFHERLSFPYAEAEYRSTSTSGDLRSS